MNFRESLQISSFTGKVSLRIGRKQEWDQYGYCKICLRAISHETQKVSMTSLFNAQSSAAYMLLQYDLNDSNLTTTQPLIAPVIPLLPCPALALYYHISHTFTSYYTLPALITSTFFSAERRGTTQVAIFCTKFTLLQVSSGGANQQSQANRMQTVSIHSFHSLRF